MPRPKGENPMCKAYGFHNEPGRKCKHCAHLQCWQASNRWYKCGKRTTTGGRATDQKINWPACSLFERIEG